MENWMFIYPDIYRIRTMKSRNDGYQYVSMLSLSSKDKDMALGVAHRKMDGWLHGKSKNQIDDLGVQPNRETSIY